MAIASVIIPTYNRAALLGETLDCLAHTRTALDWEVVVVDNNSTDRTREAVAQRVGGYPVPLRYVFEPQQGRSHALNAGIAASDAAVFVFTDDDVRVSDCWLDAATAPLLDDSSPIEYTGGPVRPIWEAPRPAWLSPDRGDLWGTIAILNYGDDSFVFEEHRRVPLGANMAVRRSLVERIGLFSTVLGRTGQRLLGQEVPEFLARARAAGAHGLYVPGMLVHHHVPGRRLTKTYFRRWWFGKGISRSQLDSLQPVTELGLDLRRVRRLAGLPLFMVRSAATDIFGWVLATVVWDAQERTRHEMMLCYFLGYVAGRRRRYTSASSVGKLLPS